MKKLILSMVLVGLLVIIGGKTMAEENLTLREQNIVMISSYTAASDLTDLEPAIKNGLDDGLTVNEVKEVLVQLYAYCGFPKSLNGLSTLMKVAKSGNYKEGEAGKALKNKNDLHKIGTETQTKLCGAPVKGELFEFAPTIDDYLKDHLFGDIFYRGVLTWKDREIATIAALSALGDVEPQLNAHIQVGKHNGLTDGQVEEILTLSSKAKLKLYGIGEPNVNYAKYFIGNSYLKGLSKDQVNIANVTFEPKCRNNWHIHHGVNGKGGQILIVTAGRGYYQEWGKPAQELHVGDIVNIPPEVKHWHGAAKDSWFSHLAIEVPGGGATEWLEAVNDEEYDKLK